MISTLVDFPDDCGTMAFTADMVENLIERLHWMGVRRVYWNYYQDGIWPWFHWWGSGSEKTLDNIGEPMALGRRLSHRYGMEFYAVIKPYETGPSVTNPADSPDSLANPGLPAIGGRFMVDDWVARHPETRVRARTADMPIGLEGVPVRRIQLRQKDMAPVRIKPENLHIWTSDDNNGYRKRDAEFDLSEDIDTCPSEVKDWHGDTVTAAGESVRVLNVSGLDLLDPFVALTTDFDDDDGAFRNTPVEMVRAFGPNDKPIPIVVASYKAIWKPDRDMRTGDLQFDGGQGRVPICLDASKRSGSDGVVALAKGRNEYLWGAVSEGYPEVQDYWMEWVGECIAAGVDGVDVRIAGHSSLTDTPEIYGFAGPIVAEYQRRYGVNPDVEPYDPELLGDVRGDFFDQFLRSAKHRLAAAGKRLQLHLEVESLGSDVMRATHPGKINFDWRNWLRSGLADEATLFGRAWSPERILDDALAKEMIAEANAAGVPVHLNKQVGGPGSGKQQADWMEHAYRSGGLSGYTFYETASMYSRDGLDPNGKLQFHPDLLETIRARVESLGLLD